MLQPGIDLPANDSERPVCVLCSLCVCVVLCVVLCCVLCCVVLCVVCVYGRNMPETPCCRLPGAAEPFRPHAFGSP